MKKTKKGVALIWALVLSAILLIISSTMVSYIIKESRFSINIEESSRAYAAAKSGIDWGIYKINNENPQANSVTPFDFIPGDGNDTIVTITHNPAGNPVYLIASESSVFGVTRKIEYTINQTLPTIIQNSNLGINNNNSFNLEFDLWFSAIPNFTDNYQFGLQNNGATRSLYLEYFNNNFSLKANTSAGTLTQSTIGTRPTNTDQAYRLKIKIKYVENTAAKMTIEERDINFETLTCRLTTDYDLDLTSNHIDSNLNILFGSPGASFVTGGAHGDGSYYQIPNSGGVGSPNMIIDNIIFSN